MRLVLSFLATAFAACDKPPTPPATPAAVVDEAAVVPVVAPTPTAPSGDLPAGHPPTGDLPAGHPAVGTPAPARPMAMPVPAETGVVRPLPLEGSGSVAELRSRLGKIKDSGKHASLENAFRMVFTVDRGSRDNPGAEVLLTPLTTDPDPAVAALAERTLGYVRVNSGFDAEGAKARYTRALELDPDYGEAHYAMAFMFAMGDRALGKSHFDKAMALGVPDTRELRGQFYEAP